MRVADLIVQISTSIYGHKLYKRKIKKVAIEIYIQNIEEKIELLESINTEYFDRDEQLNEYKEKLKKVENEYHKTTTR